MSNNKLLSLMLKLSNMVLAFLFMFLAIGLDQLLTKKLCLTKAFLIFSLFFQTMKALLSNHLLLLPKLAFKVVLVF